MSARLVTFAVVAGAGAFGSCGASSSHTSSSASAASACQPSGGHTIAADRQARVYSLGSLVYGCSVRTGKRSALGQSTTCLRADRAGPVVLAGELAGYGLERCGVDTGSSRVIVRRLSDGRQLHSETATTSNVGPEAFITVASLALKSNGSVAWIATGTSLATHRQLGEVHRADKGGRSVLDSAPGIVSSSLRLHGSTVTWKRGHTTHSAALR